MIREKRSEQIRARVPASTKERLERHVASLGNVVTMSDWLFEMVERELTVIEISKQKLSGRIGRS